MQRWVLASELRQHSRWCRLYPSYLLGLLGQHRPRHRGSAWGWLPAQCQAQRRAGPNSADVCLVSEDVQAADCGRHHPRLQRRVLLLQAAAARTAAVEQQF